MYLRIRFTQYNDNDWYLIVRKAQTTRLTVLVPPLLLSGRGLFTTYAAVLRRNQRNGKSGHDTIEGMEVSPTRIKRDRRSGSEAAEFSHYLNQEISRNLQ